MINLHDNLTGMDTCTLTERGQVSVPASLRKAMGLKPGCTLRFEQVSPTEIRLSVIPAATPMGLRAALGYARKLFPNRKPRSTESWMREIRGGERP